MTEAELVKLEDYDAPHHVTGEDDPSNLTVADTRALTAEVRRLRALVKTAFREGVELAYRWDGDHMWEASDARKALDG